MPCFAVAPCQNVSRCLRRLRGGELGWPLLHTHMSAPTAALAVVPARGDPPVPAVTSSHTLPSPISVRVLPFQGRHRTAGNALSSYSGNYTHLHARQLATVGQALHCKLHTSIGQLMGALKVRTVEEQCILHAAFHMHQRC